MYVKVGASDELLPARSGLTSQIDLVCYGPHALCTLTAELPSEAIYIMILTRTNESINKAEDDGGYMPKSGSQMRVHQQNPRRVLR